MQALKARYTAKATSTTIAMYLKRKIYESSLEKGQSFFPPDCLWEVEKHALMPRFATGLTVAPGLKLHLFLNISEHLKSVKRALLCNGMI